MDHFIFGGEGFIGSHLFDTIISKGVYKDNVFSYDIKKKNLTKAAYNFIDVRLPISMGQKVSNSSIIYNLAAIHTTPGHADKEYFETNILGAENICNFARDNDIETIVFTSSIAPYGASESYKTETSIPMPNIPYGISKLTAEYIHKLWQAEKPNVRRLIIVRPGVVFGKSEGGNFTRLYKSLKKGFFFYPGRKDTIKACVYVKDVTRILFESSQNEFPGATTFNLSLFPAPSIEEICESIANVTKVRPPKILVPGWILKTAAKILYFAALSVGKKINGIHPDRVKKLMISTNISGEKLNNSPYKLQFTLEEALNDWFKDCNKEGLY